MAVNDYATIVGDLHVTVIEELRRRGVEIPLPQREVRLLQAA